MKYLVLAVFACLCVLTHGQPLANTTTSLCNQTKITTFLNGYNGMMQDNDLNQYLDKVCLFYFDRYSIDDTSGLDFRVKNCVRNTLQYYGSNTADECHKIVGTLVNGCCTDQCFVMACSNVTVPKGASFNCSTDDTRGKLSIIDNCISQYYPQTTCSEAVRSCLLTYEFDDFLYGNIPGAAMLLCYENQNGKSCDSTLCYKESCGQDATINPPQTKTSKGSKGITFHKYEILAFATVALLMMSKRQYV